MEILWKRQKLKDYVEAFAKSNRITARRMGGIKAAIDFRDLECDSNGRAHFLKGDRSKTFAIDLERPGNGKRLICIPVGADEDEDGFYMKETITTFEVIDIEDYH